MSNNHPFKLKMSHIKILDVINELNKLSSFPNSDGVKKILHGEQDNETFEFSNIPPFGSLLSISGRKICAHIINLQRRGYLAYIYDKDSNEMFLQITLLGEDSLQNFKNTHHINYKTKHKQFKKTILKKD
jgi:hypothetical protein